MVKKSIIITSIAPPTEAVRRFSEYKDWQLIVVGDRKSPEEWSYKRTVFLSIDDQERLGYNVTRQLPYDHYCRKMVGYIHAARMGAEIIVDTDDDNHPKDTWSFPSFIGEHFVTRSDLGFVNIYRSFTGMNIWPRGFPLKRINDESTRIDANDLTRTQVDVGIWQGLADGDPDVDAIYRLVDNTACIFNERDPLVLSRGTFCPFNSQNTAFRKEFFPLLYLPTTVSFRFTDILRGLVAQPLLHLFGSHLGFLNATVVQERNVHDYLMDFESEIPCYLFAEKVIEIVSGCIDEAQDLNDNLCTAYGALCDEGIVQKVELDVLKAFLEDLS